MKKIKIVEDDRPLSRELKQLLESEGYQAEETSQFDQLTEELLQSDADLILLDINLPGVNGEELLRRFRSEKETPVIMLTSRTTETDEVLSMSYGADDYITKPYHPAILLLPPGNGRVRIKKRCSVTLTMSLKNDKIVERLTA